MFDSGKIALSKQYNYGVTDMKEHTCRDSNYWTQLPFKPCFQCMCQLSKNSAERHAKKGKKK